MSTRMTISARNVEEHAYEQFRLIAMQRKKTVGEALTEAMNEWSARQSAVKKFPFRDMKVPATGWGPGTERLSEQIDEVLYGDDYDKPYTR